MIIQKVVHVKWNLKKTVVKGCFKHGKLTTLRWIRMNKGDFLWLLYLYLYLSISLSIYLSVSLSILYIYIYIYIYIELKKHYLKVKIFLFSEALSMWNQTTNENTGNSATW